MATRSSASAPGPDDTTLYYDHWENGYSFDPSDPDSNADEVVVLRASTVTTACTEDDNAIDTPDCQTTEGYHVFDSNDIPSTGWSAESAAPGPRSWAQLLL